MASIELSRYEAEEGDLPDVCMRCGALATERKRRLFISHPVWVYLLIPFCYLPYLVVAIILTQRVRCYTLFCPRHKNYWRNRTLLIWGALPVVLVLIFSSLILASALSDRLGKSSQDALFGSACIGSLVLLFGWLASIPLVQELAIHPAHVTERRLTLKRIAPAFAEAVDEYREQQLDEEPPEDYRCDDRIRRSPRRPGHWET
jgi:hypothetical protein